MNEKEELITLETPSREAMKKSDKKEKEAEIIQNRTRTRRDPE